MESHFRALRHVCRNINLSVICRPLVIALRVFGVRTPWFLGRTRCRPIATITTRSYAPMTIPSFVADITIFDLRALSDGTTNVDFDFVACPQWKLSLAHVSASLAFAIALARRLLFFGWAALHFGQNNALLIHFAKFSAAIAA